VQCNSCRFCPTSYASESPPLIVQRDLSVSNLFGASSKCRISRHCFSSVNPIDRQSRISAQLSISAINRAGFPIRPVILHRTQKRRHTNESASALDVGSKGFKWKIRFATRPWSYPAPQSPRHAPFARWRWTDRLARNSATRAFPRNGSKRGSEGGRSTIERNEDGTAARGSDWLGNGAGREPQQPIHE
jgi:hypothetical protein